MHHHDFGKRLLVAIIFTVPTLLISHEIIQFICASIVYWYGGWPFLQGFFYEVRHRNFGMMTLVGFAITVSYFFSSIGIFLFGLQEQFFMEVVTLIDVMLFGHWIEMRAVMGASSELKSLARLLPSTAHKYMSDGTLTTVSIDTLHVEDHILVRPGEKIPADGIILEGESEINQAALTGETTPVYVKKGSPVIAGAINTTGALTMRVLKEQHESYLHQVSAMVESVLKSKSTAQDTADWAARLLTIIALVIGAATFVWWFTHGFSIQEALQRFVAVVVTVCPHALGLAIPLAVVNITGQAAQRGILIAHRRQFESAYRVDTVVFDKTGTLTYGEFEVVAVYPAPDTDQKNLIMTAASIEAQATHGVARALVAYAHEQGISLTPVKDAKTLPGKGATGTIDKTPIFVGNTLLLKEHALSIPQELQHHAQNAMKQGYSVVYVANEQRVLGIIACADRLRETAHSACSALMNMGKQLVVLTGDHEQSAQRIARILGIVDVRSRVLPDQKASIVTQLKNEGRIVAMVGDGINDAPALAASHVGIAMASGTDIARETADIIFVRNDINAVIDVLDLSQKMHKKVIQNLLWATGYNIIAVPLAAGVFVSFGFDLTPTIGALFMSMSTIVVALNSRHI